MIDDDEKWRCCSDKLKPAGRRVRTRRVPGGLHKISRSSVHAPRRKPGTNNGVFRPSTTTSIVHQCATCTDQPIHRKACSATPRPDGRRESTVRKSPDAHPVGTMSDSAQNVVSAALPLTVDQLEVNDPIIIILGIGWALTVTCPWVLTVRGSSYDSESGSVEIAARNLVGRVLVAVVFGDDELVDPMFVFDHETTLSVKADSDWDPWVLSVPGIILVGTTGQS